MHQAADSDKAPLDRVHIVFRSQGGGDEPGNLVALCDRCHLSLVYDGPLTVAGLAPTALTWQSRRYCGVSE